MADSPIAQLLALSRLVLRFGQVHRVTLDASLGCGPAPGRAPTPLARPASIPGGLWPAERIAREAGVSVATVRKMAARMAGSPARSLL